MTMKIRHLKPFDTTDPRAMEEAFAAIEPQPIACCNWPDTYPYRPQVSFRIFHTGETLWLRFDVEERYTKGEVTEDNGRVWTDSCVEFFIALDEVCHQFDLGTPIWLDMNIADFKRHNKTRFTQDSFVESIDFDYLEIQIIEED